MTDLGTKNLNNNTNPVKYNYKKIKRKFILFSSISVTGI